MVNSVISVTKMTALYLIRNLLDESSSLKTQRSPNQKLQQKKMIIKKRTQFHVYRKK